MVRGSGRIAVLYLDDREDAVSHPATAIEATGAFSVTLASNPEDALDSVASSEVDCLVASANLTTDDGRSVYSAVRERDSDLPIVVVGETLADAAVLDTDNSQLDDDPAVRFVHEGDDVTLGRTIASQVRDLVARPTGEGASLAGVPAPAFSYDDGFVDWNEDFLALVDREPEWLPERSLADVLDATPSDLAAAASADEPLETTLTTATGATRRCQLAVGRDTGRYVCLVESTTEEAVAAAAERAETMLDSLLESIPLAIYFKDRAGRHVRVSRHQVGMGDDRSIDNPEGKRHHVPADVEGKTDFDLYPAEDAERFVETDERVMEAAEPYVEEEQVGLTSEEEDLALRDMKAPWVDDDGEVLGTLGVTLDVTERWQTDRRAEVRGDVLEAIETIVRTQVRPALGDDDTLEVETDAIADSLGRQLRDVETLLRTRQLPEATEPTALAERAESAWADLATEDASLAVETSGVVAASPTLLETVFAEVFENALVHGGPDATVTVGELDDGFFVADDGPGIPPGRRSEVWRYGSTSTPDRVGGGLAVVDAVARSHGWATTIAEGADGGARLEFTGVTFH